LDQPVRVTTSYRRGVEQLVARRAHNPEVRGSSPLPATMKQTLNLWNYEGSAIFIMLHQTTTMKMMTESDCKFVDVGFSEIFHSMYQHKFNVLP
jgi:hypothetical protein